jgi:hypothetical protein
MYKREQPIWTASQMEDELETGYQTETVRNKLDQLEGSDICDSMPANNGRIYWLNHERSGWPIPPDVDFNDELRAELKTTKGELEELQQKNDELQQHIDELQNKVDVLQDQLTVREALRIEYVQFVLIGLMTGFASALVFAVATLQAIESIQTPFATSSLLLGVLSSLVFAFSLFLLFLVSGTFAYAYDKPLFKWLAECISNRFF